LVANLALFLLVGVSTARETYRGWSVDREIQSLEAQAENLEGRKLKLLAMADKISSPDKVELEARTRLGWKKPGEQVAVLTGYQAIGGQQTSEEFVAVPVEPAPKSIPKQWFDYFFHSKR